jgi:hypothetical protein
MALLTALPEGDDLRIRRGGTANGISDTERSSG